MLLRKCLSRSRLVFNSIKKAIKRIQVHESQVISMRQIFLPEFTDFENRSSDVTSFMWRWFERVQSTAVAWPVFSAFLLQQHNGHSSDQLPTDRQWLGERKSVLRDVPSVKTQPFTPQGSSFVSPAKLSVAYWKKRALSSLVFPGMG